MPDIAERIVESLEHLPDAAAREILDFAQFLLQKEAERENRGLIAA